VTPLGQRATDLERLHGPAGAVLPREPCHTSRADRRELDAEVAKQAHGIILPAQPRSRQVPGLACDSRTARLEPDGRAIAQRYTIER
jgi:hypothetical protein